MNYENSKNETESLSADEQKLRQMCRALKKVEAPKDFDFKLKARISNAKAADFEPRGAFLPAMRYALPALALILMLGFLAYTGGFLSAGNNSTVAQNPVAAPDQAATAPQSNPVTNFAPPAAENSNTNAPAPTPAGQNASPAAPENAFAVRRAPKLSTADAKRRPAETQTGGSTDISQKEAQVITPQSLTPARGATLPPQRDGDAAANPISVREVLSQNGINADLENGKWTVKSVTPNSLGDSSGVKQNDVIEAIDEQPISAGTVFNKIVNGKSLTVTRGGQRNLIRLRNKQ